MTPTAKPGDIALDAALAALAPGGSVAAGRFTLLRVLGRGGTGVVWLARDEQLRDEVALKFLPPEIRHDAVALDDLRRETARSRKLTHPHIVRIHDFYSLEQEAFVSMEYVDGRNLSERRLDEPNRVLGWAFLDPLVKQLCDALQYAHDEKIIHRDLKPANMMLDGRGRMKLADFGIAATLSDSGTHVSVGRHALSGTPSYMSPQQLDGEPPSVTDDIYSLGSSLYELLTGRAPFFTGDIAHQVRSLPPQPLEKRLAQMGVTNPVPPAVAATIMAALAKDPQQRPQSANAFAEMISGRHPVPVKTGIPTDDNRAPAAPFANPTGTPSPRPGPSVNATQRRRPASLIIAAAALLVAAVAATGWWRAHRPVQHPAPGTAAVEAVVAPTPPKPPEFVSLLNGRDLSGWDGDTNVWSSQEGMLTATGGKSKEQHPRAIFWTGGSVTNFELRLSFRIESGNSGIYYRARAFGDREVGGYQFEIAGDKTGMLLETGSDRLRRVPSKIGQVVTANVVNGKEKIEVQQSVDSNPADVRRAFHASGWNEVEIIARGNHLVHRLNGETIADTHDEYEKRPQNGAIAFEVYGSQPTTVHFRDIRLKRLPPGP